MRKVHLVVCDLFLPADIAAEVCADLRLPALEKMLARGASTKPLVLSAVEGSARTDVIGQASSTGSGRAGDVGASLENYLCELFGVPCQNDAPIAPVSAAFDGLGEGCWLRADPVHLRLQRDQLVLLPDVEVSADEAGQLCATLNEYFAGQGMEFFAPHLQRWYMRVDRLPDIETVPLMQVAGCNVRGLLPKGAEAGRWHRIFNEIQMLLFAHPVNEAREARGELPVNSLWLWGGGTNVPPRKTYDCVSSDEVLAGMFAAAAGIPFSSWPEQWHDSLTLALSRGERGFSSEGRQLLVWTGLRSALQRGDLDVWRAALQEFETGYVQPLWQALRAGKISQLQVDILGGDRVRHLLLTRADTWAFWRRAKSLFQ
ncbi:MAG TPA: hypothetical protein VFQ94_00115 [Gallionella sp.]|nr:hypothetical protein [Gallionella sp.]